MNATTEPQTSDLDRLDSAVDFIAQQIRGEFDKKRETGEWEPSTVVDELLKEFKFFYGRAALERIAIYTPERHVLEMLAEEARFEDLLAFGLSEETVCEAAGTALAAVDFAAAVIRGITLPKPIERPSRPARRRLRTKTSSRQ